jgi:hypothetical protein
MAMDRKIDGRSFTKEMKFEQKAFARRQKSFALKHFLSSSLFHSMNNAHCF